MNQTPPTGSGSDDLRAVIEQLSKRLSRVEKQLGIAEKSSNKLPEVTPIHPGVESSTGKVREQESLEFEVGQTWFAVIGIIALAVGMAFVLTLKYENWHPALPGVCGYVMCGILFALVRLSRTSFEVVSIYLRVAGMLLLFLTTVRFFYFGEVHALDVNSLIGRGLFIVVLAINLGIGWVRKSSPLFILALFTGLATALAIGSTWFVLILITGLSAIAVYVQVTQNWRRIVPVMFPLTVVAYVIWAVGNPLLGHEFKVDSTTPAAIFFILLWTIMYSSAVILRREREREDSLVQISGLLMCGLGFGTFFLHALIAYDSIFLISHVAASIVFLSIAVVYWIREESSFSTFIYGMTGYAGLSFALMKGFAVPQVFVALSLQSLVVIATAIWFRSRFIIVANWLIFLGIIIAYIVLTETEIGLSLGFGIVALVSARVLNWQQNRLVLRTQFMRVAYLAITFCVFPYGFYYLAPEAYLAVAWVGLSLLYYVLSFFLHNRRYRWMGHMTLLLTVLYVMVVGTARMETTHRIISFLVLGTILLVVSLVFTQLKSKRLGESRKKDQP